MEYMEVMDEDTHHYVIPTSKHKEWHHWLYELAYDDPERWSVPEYATQIDGGHLIFKEWRIGKP